MTYQEMDVEKAKPCQEISINGPAQKFWREWSNALTMCETQWQTQNLTVWDVFETFLCVVLTVVSTL